MEPRRRDSSRAREIFELVERFLASGLSQIEFCRQNRLRYSTFSYWMRQHRARQPAAREPSPTEADPHLEHRATSFIPLHIQPNQPTPACVIEFPHGVVVRLSGPVDPKVLSQLIHPAKREP